MPSQEQDLPLSAPYFASCSRRKQAQDRTRASHDSSTVDTRCSLAQLPGKASPLLSLTRPARTGKDFTDKSDRRMLAVPFVLGISDMLK